MKNDEMRVQKKLTDLASIATKAGGTEEVLAKLTNLEDDFYARGKVHRIVLTGGPCAGKSTIMSDMVQMLKENNYLVAKAIEDERNNMKQMLKFG